MEHITIDSEAFTLLCEKIDQIAEYITKERGNNEEEDGLTITTPANTSQLVNVPYIG